MKRRINSLWRASLASALAVFGGWNAAAATNQPNIIFVLADDMGWGDLGVFYQNSRNFAVNRAAPAFMTPKLDTVAAEGLQLRRHYCPAPVCAPSRASLLLGVHQGHANIRDNQFDKALEDNHTLGTVLKQAGYATAMIGKYGLQGAGLPAPARPELRGFDFFFGYLEHGDAHWHYPKETGANVYDGTNEVTAALDKCYSTDFIAARTKKWIVDHRADRPAQPFFIYLAFTAPHARLDVPTQAYPAGSGTNGGLQWLGTPGNMINTASGTINSWIHPDYAAATYDNDNSPGTPEVAWPDYAKRHATMMRRIDDAVGDLIQTLKDLSIDTNTLIVFTSDNGPHNEAGSGGSYTYNPTFFDSFGPMDGIKRDSWEGGMREPTLVRWPGRVPAGTTNYSVSQFHDWLPTFAQLAGLPGPARSDGVSLVPTLTGTGTQRPSTIYLEYNYAGTTPTYTEFEASRRGATRNQEQVLHLDGYKGIRYNVAAATDNFRIYDTLVDPKEVTDLAASSPFFVSLQQRMKDRALQLRRPGGGVSRPYDSALIPPAAIGSVVAGLNYGAYEDSFPWVPDFTTLTARTNGTCSGIDLTVRTREDNIGLVYTGYLTIPADGTYTIYLNTDGRAFLRLHEASVIDADYGYPGGTERSSAISLKAGHHPIRLGYVRGTGGTPSISLEWSGPGIVRQAIPSASLVRPGASTNNPPTALNDNATTPRDVPVTVDVLANDLAGGGPGPIRLLSVASPAAGSVATNLSGQVVYTPNPGFLGEDSFTYTMTDGLSNATASVKVKVFFSDGLIWFPFNQTSGLTTDEAGGAYTGMLNGFNSDPDQWIVGRWNRALDFNGTSSYVSIPGYNGILGASNRTCAAWVKTSATGQLPVIAWGPNAAGAKWIFLVQNGHARVEITSGYLEGTRVVNDGQWHHIAVVYSNNISSITNARLYVDGVVETSFTASLSLAVNTTSAGEAKIGSDVQGRFFTGAIDEPRIYNRALSAAEIAELYGAPNQSAAAWHRRHFGSESVNWQADDDLDGGPRLLEYAFGTAPGIADDPAAKLTYELSGGRLRLQFPRRVSGSSELSYIVQVSRDLLAWTLSASPVGATLIPGQPDFEQAEYQTDATVSQESAQFVRVRVSLP